jgi:hypothetical protein
VFAPDGVIAGRAWQRHDSPQVFRGDASSINGCTQRSLEIKNPAPVKMQGFLKKRRWGNQRREKNEE